MDLLAGALGGDVQVWQATVSGDGISDVSGALEYALQQYETDVADGPKPVAASVFHDEASGSYAVVLMLPTRANG